MNRYNDVDPDLVYGAFWGDGAFSSASVLIRATDPGCFTMLVVLMLEGKRLPYAITRYGPDDPAGDEIEGMLAMVAEMPQVTWTKAFVAFPEDYDELRAVAPAWDIGQAWGWPIEGKA